MVCGEALMDVFALEDTRTGTQLDACIGGSPLNVAIGLARLAQPVGFFGAVSTGFLGERLMRALASEGVDTRAVVRTNAPTTLSLVGLDAAGVPCYTFYGDSGAERQLDASALRRVDATLQALHVGSYASVVEPIASTLRALVERERGHALITYDPNVRLDVEPDMARWQAQLEWMLPRCHLLKISEEDLALLFPGRTSADFAADALAHGTTAVVVTRGARGASVWTASAQAEVPGVRVDVVDTLGAGDSFQAGMLARLA
ncbi:MAG: carbohydrate kinase, partial [Burkholderiaceae bacterium]